MHPLSSYNGNLEWLPSRTFFVTRHGSHAYGTARPGSDIDLRGIFVAPKNYYLGFTDRVEVVDKGFGVEVDASVFELRKFFIGATECNPNVLELLYTDPSDHLWVSPLAQTLLNVRDSFLSRKALFTFSGYAFSQLKRIKGHQRWLKMVERGAEPRMPTREEFGLLPNPVIPTSERQAAESLIRKKLESWKFHEDALDYSEKIHFKEEVGRILVEMHLAADDEVYRAAANSIGIDSNFMEIVMQERRFNTAVTEYRQYLEWVENRNEARAALEKQHGFDTKHAMHLVRLLRVGQEVLSTGKLLVKRPDAEELLTIRDGAWTCDEVVEYAEKMQGRMAMLAETSLLPKVPDRKYLDSVCVSMVAAAMVDPFLLKGKV